ncbi:hypothetical protein RvY_03677 [Ramazzottius varieornatus]|uniref:Uncharacterized protein n=1 Tax=Ramazzottius varieornatus TaxID=947166 RepID=A0A1D1UNW4_RAMVA|nr:hypothetical protein RvY_03677 [Ramazzottius varieornatus]
MEATRELEAAFQKEGLTFIDEAAHLMTEGKVQFAVYLALVKQILVVNQDDAKSSSGCDEPEDSAEALAESDAVEVETEQSDTMSDDDDDILYQLNDVSPFLARNPDLK